MAGEAFAEAAQEELAAFIEANYPAAIAAVETAQGLVAGVLGAPSVVLRGMDPFDPRDNKVEVYSRATSVPNMLDRSIFDHEMEIAITLFGKDAKVLAPQLRLLRWETALWNLFGKGGSTLGGVVLGAFITGFSRDTTRTPQGPQIAVGVAQLLVRREES